MEYLKLKTYYRCSIILARCKKMQVSSSVDIILIRIISNTIAFVSICLKNITICLCMSIIKFK